MTWQQRNVIYSAAYSTNGLRCSMRRCSMRNVEFHRVATSWMSEWDGVLGTVAWIFDSSSLASVECEKWPTSERHTATASVIARWLESPRFTHSCRVCAKHGTDGTPASRRPLAMFLALSRRKTWILSCEMCHFSRFSVIKLLMFAAVCEPRIGHAAMRADFCCHASSTQCAVTLSSESVHWAVVQPSVVKLMCCAVARTDIIPLVTASYSSGSNVVLKYLALGNV